MKTESHNQASHSMQGIPSTKETESHNQASHSMQRIPSTKETEDPSTKDPRGTQRLLQKKEPVPRIAENKQNVQDLEKRRNTF